MPKTSEQFEEIRKEREESILNAGLYLFATKGLEQTSADSISAIANCSHGLLYHYYKSKEDLYKAVIEKKVRPIASAATRQIDRSKKAKVVLREVIDNFLTRLKSDDDEFSWAINLLLNVHLQVVINPKIKSVEAKKRVYDWVYELIERGKEEGDFNDLNSRELVISILALFKGLSYNRIRVGYKKFICPSTDIFMEMVLK